MRDDGGFRKLSSSNVSSEGGAMSLTPLVDSVRIYSLPHRRSTPV